MSTRSDKAEPPHLEPFRWSVMSVAATDEGNTRAVNEVRFVCDDMLQLYGLADGVGGLPAVAGAAELAFTSLRRRVTTAGTADELAAIAREVNAAVSEAGTCISPRPGMVPTLTWGVFRGEALHLAHVGDSRCYCLRSGILEALSSGRPIESEARQRGKRLSGRGRNTLTRCISQPNAPEVDLLVRPVLPGDRYLFCTGGIRRALGDTEIKEFLGWVLAPEHILGCLIKLATVRGGRSHATAVLVVIGSPATA
jgi:serine/threonine protein phosphatase PrpC